MSKENSPRQAEPAIDPKDDVSHLSKIAYRDLLMVLAARMSLSIEPSAPSEPLPSPRSPRK